MIGFGIVEIVLSQIPNFHKLSWLSVIAAITSIGGDDQKRSLKWFGLQTLNFFCFLVSLAAACAAFHGINQAMGRSKPFMYKD
ncbi:hypothetical protein K1719_024556 [Acacia pycnantha]|nr:hypothetical protein K1719_024556 [Acacia pycnantha]